MISSSSQIIGQKHLIGEDAPITKIIQNNTGDSFILYGNSGIGKTTIANYVASKLNKTTFKLNAAKSTKKEFEEVLFNYSNQDLLIVIDEIHRLDKIKQNLLLPYLEKQNISIIGTTTENPIYHLHSAFRSRVLIFDLVVPTNQELYDYLTNYNKVSYKNNLLDEKIIQNIISSSGGDIRKVNQYFEFIVKNYENEQLTDEILKTILKENIQFRFQQDEHYDLISAFQKSIRASDVNAALFYASKLLLSGDHDAFFRRLAVIAYEDIGLANPNLVTKVLNAIQLFKSIGMPEGQIILSNIIIELSLSPKSQTAYKAIKRSMDIVKKNPNIQMPDNIKQNRDENNYYNKDEAFYQNLLPKEIQKEEFVIFEGDSNYELKLKEQYEKLKNYKKGKNDKR